MNGVKVTLEQDAFLVGDNMYELSPDFITFIREPNITCKDIEDWEDEKIKVFYGTLVMIQEQVMRKAKF